MNRSLACRALLCVLLIFSCATAARADYGAGRTAWKAGRYAEALTQWRLAARKGDRRAMVALGRAFVKGLGVPQDFIEAHKWLNLAAARGDAKAVAERDALAKRMTVEERAEARKLARAWQPAGGPRTSSLLPRRKAPRPASPPRRMVRKGSAGKRPRPPAGDAALRAASAGDVSALKKALAAGADPNARGRRGWTPLMYAANKGYTLLVPPLLAAGAKPDLRAADGATALFIAALHGRSQIIKALMKAGADPSIKGPKGKTAEEVGYLGKNPRVIEALGLSETIRESDGMVWKGAMLGGQRHGRWTKTKADGAIVEEGSYAKGKKHGRWRETHSNVIEIGLHFVHKKLTVSVTQGLGDRLEAGPYVEGERHGQWTLSAYYGGELTYKLEGPYERGKKHGRWNVLYGKLRWEGSYVQGKRDGLWKYSFPIESMTYHYRKGKKHGPVTYEYRERIFHKGLGRETLNFTRTLRAAYADDLLHGQYVYESKYRSFDGFKVGKVEEYKKGKYVKGKRHGKWLFKKLNARQRINEAYYRFYDNGRFIRKSPLNQAAATGGNEEVEKEEEN